MTNDEIRRRFEASIEEFDSYDFTRDKDGDYIKPDTWEAFQGFKACAADIKRMLESPEYLEEVAKVYFHRELNNTTWSVTIDELWRTLRKDDKDNYIEFAQTIASTIINKLTGEK